MIRFSAEATQTDTGCRAEKKKKNTCCIMSRRQCVSRIQRVDVLDRWFSPDSVTSLVTLFLLRQNPERTFYWFFEATCPVAIDKGESSVFLSAALLHSSAKASLLKRDIAGVIAHLPGAQSLLFLLVCFQDWMRLIWQQTTKTISFFL